VQKFWNDIFTGSSTVFSNLMRGHFNDEDVSRVSVVFPWPTPLIHAGMYGFVENSFNPSLSHLPHFPNFALLLSSSVTDVDFYLELGLPWGCLSPRLG
jgi:hypothetical protein